MSFSGRAQLRVEGRAPPRGRCQARSAGPVQSSPASKRNEEPNVKIANNIQRGAARSHDDSAASGILRFARAVRQHLILAATNTITFNSATVFTAYPAASFTGAVSSEVAVQKYFGRSSWRHVNTRNEQVTWKNHTTKTLGRKAAIT